MKQNFLRVIEYPGFTHIMSSLFLIVAILTIRSLSLRKIRKSKWRREDQRKWFVSIRNWSTISISGGLIIIWATELQTFALSVVAITAALIISGKELLLCFHGGILRSFNNMFKIGDRIEIDNLRGDVIDSNFFVTKILEIGPHNFTHQFTGRSIAIPNSLFLTKELINESFMHKYVLHVFKLSFPRQDNWRFAEKCMLEAADEECASFIDKAQIHMDYLSQREGIEVPKVNPRITYKFTSPAELEMIVRVPSPATRKGNIEQAILKRFMNKFLPNPDLTNT